jgi:hypothetical protein
LFSLISFFFLQWISRVSELLERHKQNNRAAITKVDGYEAARLIAAAAGAEPAFTLDDVECGRLQVSLGMRVAVTPDDTGM